MSASLSDTIKGQVRPGSRIIAAVSGGSDSCALLHLLVSAAEEADLQIYAVHFNHQLRGEESDEDERFTRALCSSLGVECITRRLEVTEYSRAHHMATEEAARILRYRALEEIRQSLGAELIATAHTRDDRTETTLLNIFRGTGLGGLSPLPLRRGCYFRPLVNHTKQELLDYLAQRHIPYRTDSSNLSDIYRRNRLRNTVLPMLRRDFNPGIDKALEGLGEIAELAGDYILTETRAFLEARPRPLPVSDLISAPAIIRYTAIRELIRDAKGEYKDITLAEVRRIDSLLLQGSFTTELTGGGIYAVSDGESFRITKKQAPAAEDLREFTLRAGDTVTIDGATYCCEPFEGRVIPAKDRLCISGKLLPLRIAFATGAIRALPMEMAGMEGKSKKIGRILKDAHIPLADRGRVLVFFDCGGRPLWIPDCALGAQVKAKEAPLFAVTRR
ncbi:MAG: tRNA lysidine(34) synthetase TilS [Abditibacteriota bacterium]|nr:tRNA lysidine(34) synthetase TilS [Abditibacteriota bacterium]